MKRAYAITATTLGILCLAQMPATLDLADAEHRARAAEAAAAIAVGMSSSAVDTCDRNEDAHARDRCLFTRDRGRPRVQERASGGWGQG